MINWLRDDGGPVFYSASNRTSVTGDASIIACLLVFLTLYVAFLAIFPGIRKQKFSTFTTVTISLFVGNTIILTKLGSSWHVGTTRIRSTCCAFSKALLDADLGAYIGLNHVNITLKVIPSENSSNIEDINYNERFEWNGVHEMSLHYHNALQRGLPFPILIVAEYFTLDTEGFCWGVEYRAAGYYGNVLLWVSLVSWLLMNLLFIVVPRYGAYAMVITSMFLLLTCLVYSCLLPSQYPLIIPFEQNNQLVFSYGWCYYLTLFSGVISGITGIIVACIDLIYPHRFSTVLEVDYDTPYDRHIIIEDSHYHSKKRATSKPSEDTSSNCLGGRILSRLSFKTRRKDECDGLTLWTNNDGRVGNETFEMDNPAYSQMGFTIRRPTMMGNAIVPRTAANIQETHPHISNNLHNHRSSRNNHSTGYVDHHQHSTRTIDRSRTQIYTLELRGGDRNNVHNDFNIR